MKEEQNNQDKLSQKDFTYAINETGDYRDTWRIFRIMAEFVEGYQFLSKMKKEVTVLGSARFSENDAYYVVARKLGALLGSHGYTTVTGGGPGVMEGANRGATEANGESVGINIQLPLEQRVNPYVKKSVGFYYFFTRKVMLTSPAHAFVFFPGGFGTLDEFFEVVDHITLGKMCQLPLVLVGKEYWSGVIGFLQDRVCQLNPTRQEAIQQWHIVDTAEEAFEIIDHPDEEIMKLCELSPLNFYAPAYTMHWRIFCIMAELVEGFEFLTGLVEDVTILGTKGVSRDSAYYQSAYVVGKRLAEQGYAVVTGGAEGIAEAANKGAMEAGGQSFGIGMEVHGKARMNPYVNKSIVFRFPFTRKLIVSAPSKAFIFFPGGFGTLHQLFEVLTLIQTGKMERLPIILFDSKFWQPLDTFIREELVKTYGTIATEDAEIYRIVDDEEDIIRLIDEFRHKVTKRFGLQFNGKDT